MVFGSKYRPPVSVIYWVNQFSAFKFNSLMMKGKCIRYSYSPLSSTCRAGGSGESPGAPAPGALCLARGANHRRGGQLGHDAPVHACHRSKFRPRELHWRLPVRWEIVLAMKSLSSCIWFSRFFFLSTLGDIVADPHFFYTDPDPAFHFDTDLYPTVHFDPDPDPTIWCGSESLLFHWDNVPTSNGAFYQS